MSKAPGLGASKFPSFSFSVNNLQIMNKSFILAALLTALSVQVHAQPQQSQIVSKADRSTVEFVVRDGKPILMDIYQFKDQKQEGGRPVFI